MLGRLVIITCLLAIAISSQAGPPVPLGTLTSTFGTARVSGRPVPSGAAVFSGDTIETGAAQAIFTFREGDSIMLGANARVRVSRAGNVPAIEVLKGMSRVQLRSKELKLVASKSKWTLQARPDANTGRVIADVLLDAKGDVSLYVQEGELVANNAAGKPFAVAKAGRPTRLPASAVPPTASARPPIAGSRSKAAKVAAYAGVAAAIGVGVAVIAAGDTGDEAARIAAEAARAQAQALADQNAALQAQVNALLTQVETEGALSSQLASMLSRLQALQAQIEDINQQLSDPNLSNAQVASLESQLASLQSQQQGVQEELGGFIGTIGEHFG